MKEFLKKGISLLLAFSLLAGGMPLSAEEETAGALQSEIAAEEEPAKYPVHLSTQEGCRYAHDPDRLGEADNPNEVVLLYAAGEEVQVTLQEPNGYQILQVQTEKGEPVSASYEAPLLTFTMPQEAVWVSPSLNPTEPSSSPEETEPPQAQTETESSQGETQTETNAWQAEETETDPQPPETQETALETEPLQDGEVPQTERQTQPSSETFPAAEEAEPPKEEGYTPETEGDGLPLQGSIVSVEGITIPYDTWDFDPKTNFQGLGYTETDYTIQYVSDDIAYDQPGTYSTIYRVDSPSGKFWFLLRPVTVSPETEAPDSEPDSEAATEMEETQGTETAYALYVTENPYVTLEVEKESYQPGESVQVEATAKEGYLVTGLTASTCKEEGEDSLKALDPLALEKTESLSATEPEARAQNEKAVEGLMENQKAAKDLDIQGDVSATYTFTMPETDVLLTADAQSSVLALSLSPRAEEEAVPDKFKLVVSGQYSAPSGLKAGNAATTYKTVVFQEEDGNTTTRMAYCIQPRQGSPGSGTTYDKDKAVALSDGNSMAKAMYYLYGGPAWGKTVQRLDGGSVNLKTLLTEAGCTSTGHYYTMTHYILSYLYMKGENWNWNSNESNVLNSKGVSLVKEIVQILGDLSAPTTTLSETALTASALSAGELRVSGSTTYKAIEENTAKVTLPEGITLVNETSGRRNTGTATLTGGDTFHLEVADSYAGPSKLSLTLTCKYAVDYTAFKLEMSGYQDIGFSYYSGDKKLSLSLQIEEAIREGSLQVQKIDAATGSARPINARYSLAGAVYTVYRDAACKEAATTLTTGADGTTQAAKLAPGTYYVKETEASPGYQLDAAVYPVTVTNGGTSTVASKEVPKTGSLLIQKEDSVTGSASTLSSAYQFTGAVYTVYADAACKEAIATLSIDASGKGSASGLYFGQYYVKETKAPANGSYALDETVYPIVVDETHPSVSITSDEQPIRKQIEIQKYDADTGKTEPYNHLVSFAGAEYTVYRDAACKEAAATLTTDAAGYGKSDPLPVADYYVKETKAPSGYQLDATVHRVTMDFSKTLVYALKSEEQVLKKPIEVQKYDADTGAKAPISQAASFAGAEYTIYQDAACKQALETLKTDETGYGKSRPLPISTYYVKETKAPEGYLMDETVYEIQIADDGKVSYQIASREASIRGSLMLMKYLDDDYDNSILQDWVESGRLKGICFTLTHEDENVESVRLTTDAYGYAATKERELVYGTWTLTEDPDTTPEGYTGLSQAKIEIQEDGVELKYIVTNDLQDAAIRIEKRDAKTGEPIPLSGAKFQVLDAQGTPVLMPDNLDYSRLTDTFTTNEEGVIVLTKPLRPGSYTLKEVEAPIGYQLAKPLPFTVEGKATYEEPLVLQCLDEPQMGRIQIQKKEAGTLKPLGEGFTFEIRVAEDITDAAGNLRTLERNGVQTPLKAGTFIEELSTNADGMAVSNDLYLGSYLVTETGSAETYAVDPTPHTVTLSYDREVETVEAELLVANEKTTLEILKVDSESTEGQDLPLAGVRFRLFTAEELENLGGEIAKLTKEELAALGTEYVTDETGRIRIEGLLHDTVYYLFESEPLPGYPPKTELYKITVDSQGRIAGASSCTLKISNVANLVEISKKEITGKEELPGATLTLKNESGEVVETWVSTEEPHRIKGLPAGTYTLMEEQAPKGYALAEEITFTLSDRLEVTQVTMYDEVLTVEVSKKDAKDGRELPGAKLAILDPSGNQLDTWTSGETPHRASLPVGTYLLRELQAPEGYATAKDLSFEIREDLSVTQVELFNQPIQVEVSKKDLATGEELSGAKLTVTDGAGKVVEEWVSDGTPHALRLPVGTYTLTETEAPKGYAKAESIAFTVADTEELQTVELLNQKIQVEISKKDLTNGEELPGAKLTVTDADGKVIEEWVSAETPHRLQLPAGAYTLTETEAPKGYARAESIAFTVTDTPDIQKVEMMDSPIQVEISKKDLTNGEELPGAKLTITDEEGNTVEEWISTKEPHKLSLPAGTYTLTEITAPDGYEVAESIAFTVTDTQKVQPVTMYDAPKEDTVDLTGKKETKTTSQGGSVPYSGGGGSPVTASPVKTGDFFRYLPALLLLSAGTLLFLLSRKKGKKKKE